MNHPHHLDAFGKRLFLRLSLALLVLLLSLSLPDSRVPRVHARTVPANCGAIDSYSLLDACIIAANQNPDQDTLRLSQSFDLTGFLTPVSSPVTVEGDGYALSGNNAYRGFFVNSSGLLTLNNITIRNTYSASGSWGGAVSSVGGTVHISNSTLENNSTPIRGAAIFSTTSTVTLTDSSLLNNSSGLEGGAVYNYSGSSLTVTRSTLSGNSTGNNGGAISSSYGATVSVVDSAFTNNSARLFGGAIYASNTGTLTVATSTISGNSANSGHGGAIYSDSNGTLTVAASLFSGNSANNGQGGAIYNYQTSATLTDSTLSDNSARDYGGGIFTSYGSMSLVRSTLSGNSAGEGAGIFTDGVATTTLTNSTLVNNSATIIGGALSQYSSGATTTLTNSTLVNNSATAGGGGFRTSGSTLYVRNTIVANNVPDSCWITSSSVAVVASLSDDSTCSGFTVTPYGDLNLGPLEGNPAYFPLLNGSAAIDAGDATYCPSDDQRGATRPQGNGCDIGSYEASFAASAPVANADSYPTDEDVPLAIDAPGVLGNDTGANLTASVDTNPGNGWFTFSPDGSFTYTPSANWSGTDSFTYHASDGHLNSAIVTVTITVNPVNDAPDAVDDSVTTDEDMPVTFDVAANDTDVDNNLDPASVTVTSGPSNAIVNHGDGTMTYTPAPDVNGGDSFTYDICDLGGLCDTATVTIIINPVNDAPVALDDSAETVEDTPVTIDVLANDTDVDGDGLTVDSVAQGSGGVAAVNNATSVTYTPNANFNGTDLFTYTVSDGQGGSATASVTVTIAAVNDPPVLTVNSPAVVVDEGQTAVNGGSVGDVDGDVVYLSSSIGTVTNQGDGTWSWSFASTDGPTESQPVTVTANDGIDSVQTTFDLTVTNVAPLAAAGPDQTVNLNAIVTLSGSLTDPAGPADAPYTWTWDLTGDGIPDTSGTTVYGQPVPVTTSFALEGTYTLTFGVVDNDLGASSDTLMVTVLNQPPTCSGAYPSQDFLWPPQHQMEVVNILGVTDPDGNPLSITITGVSQDEPTNGLGDGDVSPDGQGIGSSTALIRAERAGDGDGRTYHITFTAADGHGGVCQGTVLVGVNHDQGKKGEAVDGGALYDSTLP